MGSGRTCNSPPGPLCRLGATSPNAFFQVRTRGSIKRRPPSRRFRRSQSDCGELGDFRAPEPSQENGAQEDAGDEVFVSKSKAPGSPPPGEGALGSHEKPPLRRMSSGTEKQEEKAQAPEEAPGDAKGAAAEPHPATSTEAQNGRGSPSEGRPAAEQEGSAAEVKQEGPGGEEEPEPPSRDTKRLEEGAQVQETPQTPPGGAEDSLTPEEGKGQEKQEEATAPEPGCSPTTGSEAPETEVGAPLERLGRADPASQVRRLRCSLRPLPGSPGHVTKAQG